jgi:hypothetical protein
LNINYKSTKNLIWPLLLIWRIDGRHCLDHVPLSGWSRAAADPPAALGGWRGGEHGLVPPGWRR